MISSRLPIPTLSDPISGRSGGILQRACDANVCPKVLHLDTESDLWQARSSLVTTDTSGTDIAMPDEVRVYTVSGASHAPFRPLSKPVMQLPGNRLGYGAFMRALLVALFEWVEHGVPPPASRFPSRASGTLVALAESRATFPKLPQVNFPNVLNELRLRDHSVEPPIDSMAYPVFVQATDADGNALDGSGCALLRGERCSTTRLLWGRACCPRIFRKDRSNMSISTWRRCWGGSRPTSTCP